MFQIRSEQLLALEEARLRQFARQLLPHVREFFPGECASAGVDAVREALLQGVRRARAHGFTSERDVTKYINLMFTFGRDFDRLPWVSTILGGADEPALKMARLYVSAMERAAEGEGFLARSPEEA